MLRPDAVGPSGRLKAGPRNSDRWRTSRVIHNIAALVWQNSAEVIRNVNGALLSRRCGLLAGLLLFSGCGGGDGQRAVVIYMLRINSHRTLSPIGVVAL